MRKAIFLDRDGTINEDVGDLFSKDNLFFIPRAIEALRLLQEKFVLFIVTNQSGIGKGAFSEKEFLQFNEYFKGVLEDHNIDIRHIYYCPHRKEEKCICYKPKTFFLKQAEKEYFIDLSSSYVIGDHPHDIEMGREAGAKTVYLLSGHGNRHRREMVYEPDHISSNLYEAAAWILEKPQ